LLSGAAGDESTIKIWDMEARECVKTINAQQTVMCASANAGSTRAVIGGHSGMVSHWDIHEGKRIASLKGHSGNSLVWSVAITPDGRFAVSGSQDKTVKVWDLEAGTCVGTLEGHQSSVHSVAISPTAP